MFFLMLSSSFFRCSAEVASRFPLLGLGVGNLAHDKIREVTRAAVADYGVGLIDTAAASRNEHLIFTRSNTTVVTKVWYTHLGYERTRLSVMDSLGALGKDGSKVICLIHWPRCRRDVEWMRCEQEELELDERVRKLPRGDWRESWRALEDLYEEGRLDGIGVSNFERNDILELADVKRITPHLIQINLWSFLFDFDLVRLCRAHSIPIQVYNVMNGAVVPLLSASKTRRRYDVFSSERFQNISPSTIVLASLIQRGIGVIPRSTNHLRENSPEEVDGVGTLNQSTHDAIDDAMRDIFANPTSHEENSCRATFTNHLSASAKVYWISEAGEKILVVDDLPPGGGEMTLSTFRGHRFMVSAASENEEEEEEIRSYYEVVDDGHQRFRVGGGEL